MSRGTVELIGTPEDPWAAVLPNTFPEPKPELPRYLALANDTFTGWLSPQGKWYFCGTCDHDATAAVIAAYLFDWAPLRGEPCADDVLVSRGFVRAEGNHLDGEEANWQKDAPHTLTHAQRRELLEAGYDPDNEQTPWLRRG